MIYKKSESESIQTKPSFKIIYIKYVMESFKMFPCVYFLSVSQEDRCKHEQSSAKVHHVQCPCAVVMMMIYPQ